MRVALLPFFAARAAGGTSIYEHALLRELARRGDGNAYEVMCLWPEVADALRAEAPGLESRTLRPRNRWISLAAGLPLSLLRRPVDLLHALAVPPPWVPTPLVFTLHCSSTFVHPEYYPAAHARRLNRLFERSMPRARAVICVSRNVADLAAERFGVDRERLIVVHEAAASHFRPLEREACWQELEARHGVRPPYFLAVGRIEPRKNPARILEAFRRLRDEIGPELQLVWAGRRYHRPELLDDALDRLGLRGAVREIGQLPPEELPQLYAGAEALIFPSLWEGFGLPVLEAMACGTPVVTSNRSSLPEIAGDAALLVDPEDVDAIAGAALGIYRDPELRRTLCKRGLERARDFSWERTARETVAVYERVSEGSGR